MAKLSDKAIRSLLQDATFNDPAPWHAGSDGWHGFVADSEGERATQTAYHLAALAPDLASEVLELRREVRRLKRERGTR